MKIIITNETTGVNLSLKTKGLFENKEVLKALSIVQGEQETEEDQKFIQELNMDAIRYAYANLNNERVQVLDNEEPKLSHVSIDYSTKKDLSVITKKIIGASKDKQLEEVKSRPKAHDLLGSERSLSYSIGDVFYPKATLKTYINCPNCQFEGDKMAEPSNRTACPECNEELFLAYAADNDGEQDEDGYDRHATRIFKTKRGASY